MASPVEQKVKQIIVEQLGVDESQVDNKASFVDDLGADSLDIVELVMAFEEAFELEIPDEDAEKIATVGDAVTYIESKKKVAAGTLATAAPVEHPGGTPAIRAPQRFALLGGDKPEDKPPQRRTIIPRRVVVTGIGLLTAIGDTTEQTWKALLECRNGISRIESFDASAFNCQIAGEIKHFDPARFIEKKEIKKMGRFIQLAIAATHDAMTCSGLKVTEETAERIGVYVGSGIGGFEVIEREHKALLDHGPRRISPFFIPATIINLASGFISIRTGAKGPNSATATACTTSAHAIGDSFKIIQRGDADAMISGGSEACITPLAVGGFAATRALSQHNGDPAHASRPFDRDRDGFIIGEGSGILILEELEFAKRRGAPILAEIVGYGMSGDAHHFTAPPADGEGAFRVMRNALKDAWLTPDQIDYVNAHGTSTPLGDHAETIAITHAFSDHARRLAVSSTKSMTGHLLGGAGGLEAGIVVCALRDQVAPPTINYQNPDPGCDLDYVPNEPRPMKMEYALSNSFGFGGTNGALIFKRFAD